MKKFLLNFGVSFNFLFVSALVLIFSGCAREKGTVSFRSEKLRKESLEIESGRTIRSEVEKFSAEKEVNSNPQSVSEKTAVAPVSPKNSAEQVTASKPAKAQKLNPVQKLAAKKLAKALSPEQNLESKRGGLDQNLKLAIILGVVGLILIILGTIVWPFYLLGVILIVIALVFFLLWALNQ